MKNSFPFLKNSDLLYEKTVVDMNRYKTIVGEDIINQLHQIADCLKGKKIVHINSVRTGGGVAEILLRMLPLSRALGLDARWEVLEADEPFFECTKMFHNLLQGKKGSLPSPALLEEYEKGGEKNAKRLTSILQNADIVFAHDPQPLALISHFPQRKGKWIWRCHIDLSTPSVPTWNYLKKWIEEHDASIFSLEDFAKQLPNPTYIVVPSIDPLSEKNVELSDDEISRVFDQFNIDQDRPVLLQVSRFDRFKDPLGVIEAYKIAKKSFADLQLVLAGSGAVDDPEGSLVLDEVYRIADGDADIHVLLLPADSHRMINALQRGSDIVIQKSLKEGFGLTVSEGLWKRKPVIGGNTGGIRLQVIDAQTGFLVKSPKEAAEKICFLLQNPQTGVELGEKGREHVKEHFILTRHLREYLTVMASLLFPKNPILESLPKVKRL